MPNELEEKYQSVLDTIKLYPEQLKQAWDEISALKLPKEFKHIQNVVVCGMGGSGLGARMVDSLIVDRVAVPIETFNGYHIPNYAGKKTLVILSSYSGNTEEVISCLHDAQKKGAQIFGITTGGKLAQLLEKDRLPRHVFEPKNNPSKQPRMSIGYAAGAIFSLLSQTKTIHLWGEEIDSAFKTMRAAIKDYDEKVVGHKNLAKSYAAKLARRAPVLVASEHLAGTAHTIKNHFNENAKTFSALFELPELNHHLMEGLKYPAKLRQVFHFIFFNSKLYSDRVKKRYPLTFKVIEKNGYEYSVFTARSDKKVDQVFETLVFGSFVVYYLSKNYKIDPTKIPWVDYFKEKLAKG